MSIDFEDFFARYARSYETFDAKQVAQFVAPPCLFMLKGDVQLLASDADVVAFLSAGLATYRSNGCLDFGAEVLSARMLGPNFGEADISWKIRRADDNIAMEFQTTYVLAALSGSWKIISIIRHDSA